MIQNKELPDEWTESREQARERFLRDDTDNLLSKYIESIHCVSEPNEDQSAGQAKVNEKLGQLKLVSQPTWIVMSSGGRESRVTQPSSLDLVVPLMRRPHRRRTLGERDLLPLLHLRITLPHVQLSACFLSHVDLPQQDP